MKQYNLTNWKDIFKDCAFIKNIDQRYSFQIVASIKSWITFIQFGGGSFEETEPLLDTFDEREFIQLLYKYVFKETKYTFSIFNDYMTVFLNQDKLYELENNQLISQSLKIKEVDVTKQQIILTSYYDERE